MKPIKLLLSLTTVVVLLHADTFNNEFVQYVQKYVTQKSLDTSKTQSFQTTAAMKSIKAVAANNIGVALSTDLNNLQFTRAGFLSDIQRGYANAFKSAISSYTSNTQVQSRLADLYSQNKYIELGSYAYKNGLNGGQISTMAEKTHTLETSTMGHFASSCACASSIQNAFQEINSHISDHLTPVIQGLQQTIAKVKANIQKIQIENQKYEELLKQEKALAYESQKEAYMYKSVVETFQKDLDLKNKK